MAPKRSDYSPIRKGVDPREKEESGERGPNMWLKLSAGEQVDVICLVEPDDIIVTEQCAIWMDDGNSPVWVYTGADDPSHELKVERRYRAFLPVLHENEPKVFSMGKQIHRQLLDIADATGSLAGIELRIKRTGSALATRYSVVPKGKRYDVSEQEEVDVIALLGPTDPDGVREVIANKLGKASYDEVLEGYRGKTAASTKHGAKTEPPAPKTKKKAAPKPIVEEDEEEDLELA